jgi:hypothetical protein
MIKVIITKEDILPENDPEGKNICFECGKPAKYRNSSGWGLCADHAVEDLLQELEELKDERNDN